MLEKDGIRTRKGNYLTVIKQIWLQNEGTEKNNLRKKKFCCTCRRRVAKGQAMM
jgi:hypothetical protein